MFCKINNDLASSPGNGTLNASSVLCVLKFKNGKNSQNVSQIKRISNTKKFDITVTILLFRIEMFPCITRYYCGKRITEIQAKKEI